MPYRGPRPQPTDREHLFEDGRFIVSKTDTRGVITYANSLFIALSGYTEEELLGSPHNLVRHPDMPKAAFADLWQTIQAGKEWRGIVKNMAKDGSYYWVDAMATPSWKDGRICGFMSVRRKPDPAKVMACIDLYRRMKAEER